MANGLTVKELGWRQGTFLPTEEAARLAKENGIEGASHALILSQDCDVTHEALEVEPLAEILFLTGIEKLDSGLTEGKSSRRFHLEARKGDAVVKLQAQPWHRVQIPRGRLAEIKPELTIALPTPTLRTLIQWVAERYTRTAFPDGFVNRVAAIDERLKKLLKKHGSLFWRLLINVQPQTEVPDGQDYELDVVCVVLPQEWDKTDSQKQAKEAAAQIKDLLSGCKGIELVSFNVDSADELPLSYALNYRAWDIFNYLTHRDRLKGDRDV